MERSEISTSDILSWDSVEDIGESFEKLGFERESTSADELTLQFRGDSNAKMVVEVVDSIPSNNRDYPDDVKLAILSDSSFESYALIGRVTEDLGAVQFHEYQFGVQPFQNDSNKKYDILDILNSIDGYKQGTIEEALDIEETIKEFHRECGYLLNSISEHVQSDQAISTVELEEYTQVTLQRIVYTFLIQEKGLLGQNRERPLRQKHAEMASRGDVYTGFYEPLFRGNITELFPDASTEFFEIELFAACTAEETSDTLRIGQTPQDTKAVFEEILDTLEGWSWQTSAELQSRRIDALSPLVIGAAFERSVRSDREETPIYTPRSFTEFARREAIIPTLEERLRSQPEIAATTVEGLLPEDTGSIDENKVDDLETFYSETLTNFAILDPVMGGGAYLKEAIDTLIDIRLPILRAARANSDQWNADIADRVTPAENSASLRSIALRDTVSQNIHGVDLDPRAVQTTIFRIYLDAIAAVPPVTEHGAQSVEFDVPHVGLNLHRGNTLFGTLEEPTQIRQQTLTDFSESQSESLRNRYREAHSLSTAVEITADLYEELSEIHDQVDESFQKDVAETLNIDIPPSSFQQLAPFHWPVMFPQAMARGGFDVVLGNLPQDFGDQITDHGSKDDIYHPESEIETKVEPLKLLQQYLATRDKYGIRFRNRASLEGLLWFRSLELTRDSGRLCLLFSNSILDSYSFSQLRERLFEAERVETLFSFTNSRGPTAGHQAPAVGTIQRANPAEEFAGRFRCSDTAILTEPTDWVNIPVRFIKEFSPENYTLPSVRNQQELRALIQLCGHPLLKENEGYDFTPYREVIRGRNQDLVINDAASGDYPILSGKDIYLYTYNNRLESEPEPPDRWGVEANNDPQTSVKANLRHQQLSKLETELNDWLYGQDKDYENINEYLNEQRGEPLNISDVRAPFEVPRIAYRDIARGSDERTMIATVVPPGIPCLDTLNVVEPLTIELSDISNLPTDLKTIQQSKYNPEELLALTGILNSLPFDYLIRNKIGTGVHLSNYIVESTRAPVIRDNPSVQRELAQMVAKLNCYGEEFSEFRTEVGVSEEDLIREKEQRAELMVKIDCLVFDAYGVTQPEFVDEVVQSFRGTGSGRIINRRYLRSVRNEFRGRER